MAPAIQTGPAFRGIHSDKSFIALVAVPGNLTLQPSNPIVGLQILRCIIGIIDMLVK